MKKIILSNICIFYCLDLLSSVVFNFVCFDLINNCNNKNSNNNNNNNNNNYYYYYYY